MMNRYRPPGLIESRTTNDTKPLHNSRGNTIQPSRVAQQRSLLPHELRQFNSALKNTPQLQRSVLQRQKDSISSRKTPGSTWPTAPPVYRPNPPSVVVQPKPAPALKVRQTATASAKVPPGVYKPELVSKALRRLNENAQHRNAEQSRLAMHQRTLQAKTAAGLNATFNNGSQRNANRLPAAERPGCVNLFPRVAIPSASGRNILATHPGPNHRYNAIQRVKWKWFALEKKWYIVNDGRPEPSNPVPPTFRGKRDGQTYDDSEPAEEGVGPRERRIKAREKVIEKEVKEKQEKDEQRWREKEAERLERVARLNEKHKGRAEDTGDEISIKFREKSVKSRLIRKEFMARQYEYAKESALLGQTQYYHISQGPDTPPQHFSVRQGHAGDYVTHALIPLDDTGKVFGQETSTGPDYAASARIADKLAEKLAKLKEISIEAARRRLGGDINLMAGGWPSRTPIPPFEFTGKGGIGAFSAMVRSDKGRTPRATRYIEGILKDPDTTFVARYGGNNPTYIGTGDGTIPGGNRRGPAALRAKALEYGSDAEMSEYSSDEEKPPKRKKRRIEKGEGK